MKRGRVNAEIKHFIYIYVDVEDNMGEGGGGGGEKTEFRGECNKDTQIS